MAYLRGIFVLQGSRIRSAKLMSDRMHFRFIRTFDHDPDKRLRAGRSNQDATFFDRGELESIAISSRTSRVFMQACRVSAQTQINQVIADRDDNRLSFRLPKHLYEQAKYTKAIAEPGPSPVVYYAVNQ